MSVCGRYTLPVNELVRSAVARSQLWLNENQGTDDLALTIRILKLTEEAGEAAEAWIGTLAANPRKGQTHTRDQVAAELADVAITALVAIRSLGMDPDEVMAACATKVLERLPDSGNHSMPPSITSPTCEANSRHSTTRRTPKRTPHPTAVKQHS